MLLFSVHPEPNGRKVDKMLTLKKVKEMVKAPVHTKRVPSPKVLLEEGRIFLRKEFEHGSHLTLYHNGYVWFSAGKRNTVFHIHDCRGDYAYGASKGKGEVIKEEYFENCEWHIRALFEGEQRVEESQLKCEGVGQTKVRVSYHAVAEDWGEMADSEINVLDAAETIIGNCDTMLFLGGKESSTLKEISETLGKETIDLYNTSDTRGQSPSFGTTYQKTGKELMSRDELSVMDSARSIKMKENSILFRIQEAEERRLRLYEDYKAEILDEDEYSQLKEHYIAEKQRLEHELQKQRQRALELEKRIKICDAQMERMRGILNQNEFDEELVHELIKRIYVGMDNSVEVEFKCSDPYQEVLAIMSEVQNE